MSGSPDVLRAASTGRWSSIHDFGEVSSAVIGFLLALENPPRLDHLTFATAARGGLGRMRVDLFEVALLRGCTEVFRFANSRDDGKDGAQTKMKPHGGWRSGLWISQVNE
ncbi:unnamed protein product [Symbiodinium sp. CCMP2592]|nr:unnamed protein product [Symbiodinium sp. CCMP2592]